MANNTPVCGRLRVGRTSFAYAVWSCAHVFGLFCGSLTLAIMPSERCDGGIDDLLCAARCAASPPTSTDLLPPAAMSAASASASFRPLR